MPLDLSKQSSQVSAIHNESAIFDICIEGQGKDGKHGKGESMGEIPEQQCIKILGEPNEYRRIAVLGTITIPGFFWCCGRNIWTSLPRNFVGRCGVCTMNELVYIVEPVELRKGNHSWKKEKREVSDVTGYIHLQNKDPTGLAEKYYALDNDYRIFSHSQMYFKTLFWNTELMYDNHFLIALTRRDVVNLANATALGFQSLSAEVALIRQFTIENRLALDTITAAQGGVCALIDTDCCTYLPAKSEGLGNLSIALKNLRDSRRHC